MPLVGIGVVLRKLHYWYRVVKVEGLPRTLRHLYFYRYWRKIERLSLDQNKQHIVDVNGYRLSIIPGDKGISSELFTLNSHEPLTTSIIAKTVQPGMVCLDIGSNIGYYAFLEGKMVGDGGRIIAIEPAPLSFRYLEDNSKLNKAMNISLHNFAVGDNDGEINFLIKDRSNICRVVQNGEPLEHLTNSHIISVPIKQVDSIIDELEISNVDFVRMDTEGSEWNIYEGMKVTLKKFRPLLLIEIHLVILGHEKTNTLIKKFKTDGYESKYYISREMDFSIVAKEEYIETVSIDYLLQRLSRGTLPPVFTLLLQSKKTV
jgi:FkbM family methyltransferase